MPFKKASQARSRCRHMGPDGHMRRPWCPATRLLEQREAERRGRDDAAAAAAAKAARPGASPPRPPPRTGFPELVVRGRGAFSSPACCATLHNRTNRSQRLCSPASCCDGASPDSKYRRCQGAQEPKTRMRRPAARAQEGARLMQKNEGRWEFALREDARAGALELDVAIGRHLATACVQADVQPRCVRLLIKVGGATSLCPWLTYTMASARCITQFAWHGPLRSPWPGSLRRTHLSGSSPSGHLCVQVRVRLPAEPRQTCMAWPHRPLLHALRQHKHSPAPPVSFTIWMVQRFMHGSLPAAAHTPRLLLCPLQAPHAASTQSGPAAVRRREDEAWPGWPRARRASCCSWRCRRRCVPAARPRGARPRRAAWSSACPSRPPRTRPRAPAPAPTAHVRRCQYTERPVCGPRPKAFMQTCSSLFA